MHTQNHRLVAGRTAGIRLAVRFACGRGRGVLGRRVAIEKMVPPTVQGQMSTAVGIERTPSRRRLCTCLCHDQNRRPNRSFREAQQPQTSGLNTTRRAIMQQTKPPPVKPLSMNRLLSLALAVATVLFWLDRLASAQPAAAPPAKTGYSAEVVAKAEKILAEAGLRRSGKTLMATGAGDLNRTLTELSKQRKTIKQLVDTRQSTTEQLEVTRQQFRTLDAQNGELNLRLTRPLPAATNNQVVGMINANNVRLRQLDEQRGQLQEKLAGDRRAVNEAEAKYADQVLALRRDFVTLQKALESSLADSNLRIALKVLHVNFQTPETVDIATLLGALDRRIKQVESEIFSESIPLEVTAGGSAKVHVVVGETSLDMVLDSGAAVICLPAEAASQIGITVPADAPAMRLVLADGRTIPARGVVLPQVRIGQFTAQQVEAAVLDATAVNAEPLLGMSFLSQFRFEIDTSNRTLKLLRIGEEPE